MKKKYFIFSLLTLAVITISCGPRRYKCGPYRKCENSIEKIKKQPIYKEFDKTLSC